MRPLAGHPANWRDVFFLLENNSKLERDGCRFLQRCAIALYYNKDIDRYRKSEKKGDAYDDDIDADALLL